MNGIVTRRLRQVMTKRESEPPDSAPAVGKAHRKKPARRPDEVSQRAAAPARIMPPPPSEPRVKALTVKLTQRDYERLLRAGLSPRRTNQDMSEEAILLWLDAYEAAGR